MKNNLLNEKSIAFAIRIVKLQQYIMEVKKEYVISRQLLRSGTSVGALIRISEHTGHKADFFHDLNNAQRECIEVLYWLELLFKTNYLNNKQYKSIERDASELTELISNIINKYKNNFYLEIKLMFSDN